MHNTTIPRTDDILMVQNRQLRLEAADGVHGARGGREHEARGDILVFDPPDPHADVVAPERVHNFFFGFGVDRGYFYYDLVEWEGSKCDDEMMF